MFISVLLVLIKSSYLENWWILTLSKYKHTHIIIAANNAKMDFLFANYGYGKESSIKKENLKGVIQKPLEILEYLS